MEKKTGKKILPLTVGRFHKSKCIEGFADLGDARIHYYITGQGHPVVLLHGNGEDYTVFKDLIPLLKNRYRVIALDTRGHGLSSAGAAYWDFELFARDAAEVLAALDIEKAAVIGFSDGGNTALHMGRSFSGRLAGIVAAGANAWPGGLKGTARLGIAVRYAGYTLGAPFSKKKAAGKRRYALMVKEPRLRPEIWRPSMCRCCSSLGTPTSSRPGTPAPWLSASRRSGSSSRRAQTTLPSFGIRTGISSALRVF